MKLKPELIEEMNNFAIRVLKDENAHPQELAALPQIIGILEQLPDE